MKKVSVVIPAYNKAQLTVKTVESVLGQTYKNIEIIVVDDGSTDGTKECMLSFGNQIRYIHKENGGACSARNLGIKLATGDYIGLLDCDDLYLPKKIEKSVDFLDKNPDYGFVHTLAYIIDGNDRILRTTLQINNFHTGWIAKKLILDNFICNSTVVIRKGCFEKVGLFDESIFVPADRDIWIRIAEHYKVGYINVPLTSYRVSQNYTLNNLKQLEREHPIVLEKAFHRNPNLNSYFKRRAISNTHFFHARCLLSTDDFDGSKSKLLISLKQNPFNLKALLLLAGLILFREKLKVIQHLMRPLFVISSKLINLIVIRKCGFRRF